MSPAIIILALCVLGALALLGLATRRGDKIGDKLVESGDLVLAAGVRENKLVLELERERFERKKIELALEGETKRANILEEFIADGAGKSSAGSGLAAGDVDGRVVRLSQIFGAHNAAARAGGLPAEPAGEVHPDPAAGGPGAPDVPGT